MADILTKLNVNPIDWTIRDPGFIPEAGELWFYYNNSEYPNTTILIVGDGVNDIDTLDKNIVLSDNSQTIKGSKTFEDVIVIPTGIETSKTISASTTSLDVTGVGIVYCDTVSNDIALEGLSGGVAGQTIKIIKPSANNNLFLGHFITAAPQKLVLPTNANETEALTCNRIATFDGSAWFVGR